MRENETREEHDHGGKPEHERDEGAVEKLASEWHCKRKNEEAGGQQQGEPESEIHECGGQVGDGEGFMDGDVTGAQGAAVESMVVEGEPRGTGDAAGDEECETAPVAT